MDRVYCCSPVVMILVLQAALAFEPPLPPDAGIPIVAWQDAGKHVDEQVIVQGKIVQTRNIGKICFLNFDEARTFTAVVHEPNYKKFPKPPEEMYRDKIVRIRGLVSEFRGNPQIEVSSPDQMMILSREEPIPPAPKAAAAERKEIITIGTFNVLNFFDADDDPYTTDEGTPAKPREELERLAESIRKLDADVVMIQEVENRPYLERFVKSMLPDLGYQDVVLFEGNDQRGIDCAVLSRYPVGPVTSHRHLRFKDDSGAAQRFQRDFPIVEIRPPDGPRFVVIPVHFKSKRGGAKQTERVRLAEMRQARAILDELLKRDPAALVIVAGDFNDTWDSKPLAALRGSGSGELRGFVSDLPKDTITYGEGELREMIDFILASPAMARRYVPKSYKVLEGTRETCGSDHRPVSCRFKLAGDAGTN